jgi:hypothetical protein
MGDSSPDTVKQTSTTTPWAQQIPYLTQGFSEAQRLYNAPGPAYYPGQTVAPFAPETTLGLNAQAARASAGSPVNRAAQGYASDVLGGRYLDNPFGGAVFEDIKDRVTPAVASQFSLAGRYGPGAAMTDQLTRSLTDAYAPYAQQQYSTERANQQAIAGLAPTLANTDYQDIAAMTDVGKQRQAQAQAEIQAAQDRYNYNANLPYNKLAQYAQLIQGNYGGTTTGKSPIYQPSAAQQVLGGISTVGGLGLSLAGLLRA